MTEFSEECRNLIERSNTNVYQIAKASGLDRTTLQKMIQGKRLPSREFVDTFINYLYINQSEKENLLRLFFIEKMGKDVFFCRLEVEHLLRDFSSVKRSLQTDSWQRKIRYAAERKRSDEGVSRAVMEVDVIDAIQYIVIRAFEQTGRVEIYMDMFDQTVYVMQQIIREMKNGNKDVSVHQFVMFERGSETCGGTSGNLKALQYIFPFAFSFSGNYDVFYSYVLPEGPEQDFTLWPHYIITGRDVLLLSKHGTTGLLIENEAAAAGYISEIGALRKRCRPFFSYVGSAEEALAHYASIAASNRLLWSFEGVPCVAELLMDFLKADEFRENDLVQGYLDVYEQVRADVGCEAYRRISGFDGMEDFLEKGELPGVFGHYLGLIPEELRPKMAKKYWQTMAARQNESLLKEETEPLARELNIELYEPDKIMICTMQKDEPFGCLYVEEPGMFRVFADYFEYLINEGRVYGAGESSEVFRVKCEKIMGVPL